MNIHRVTIGGRLGSDPVLTTFDSGKMVCNLSIATNKYFKKEDGEYQAKTTWHKVSDWGKKGLVISESVKQGDPIYVEGVNEYQEWTDNEGTKRSSVKVNADIVNIVNKKQRDQRITAEDLPFN